MGKKELRFYINEMRQGMLDRDYERVAYTIGVLAGLCDDYVNKRYVECGQEEVEEEEEEEEDNQFPEGLFDEVSKDLIKDFLSGFAEKFSEKVKEKDKEKK